MKCKKVLYLFLTAILLFSLLPFAGQPAAAETSTLPAEAQAFMQRYGLNENNFSCAYYNTLTGESYAFNENKLMYSASLYKLPLNLYYYEQEAAGKISPNAKYGGYPLSTCHQLSLQYSDNGVSLAMSYALGDTSQYKHLMLKYGGVPEAEMGDAFFTGNYSNSRYMLGVLKYLYDRSDSFGSALYYMRAANPGEYFEKYVRNYTIAQKYGWLNWNINCAAIVYTNEPYLLIAFTDNAPGHLDTLCRVNQFFCDYNVAHYGGKKIGEGSLYRDVPDDSWYFKAVKVATEAGLISGVGNRDYDPSGKLQLCQAVKLAACINAKFSGKDMPSEAGAGGAWYTPYVTYAEENGILQASDFGGNYERTCTRAEMAYLFANAIPPENLTAISTLTALPDVRETTAYSAQIFALYRAGILTGFDEAGTFCPNNSITRAETAAVLARVLDSSERAAKVYPTPAPAHVVVIDPGHSDSPDFGKEPIGPGASEMKMKDSGGTAGKSSGLAEYELNLEVSLKLREVLQARGYTVYMTRETNDKHISNIERAQYAKSCGGEILVRIHANGSENTGAHGAMTICQTASNPYRQLYTQSRALSDDILAAYTTATGITKEKVWETDTMTCSNWCELPTTILELGYMTNPTEDLKMADAAFQQTMAAGIADGIDRYFAG